MSLTQQAQNKRFWQFKAAADNSPAELILYGDIASETWWGDEITPRQFSDDLNAIGAVSEIVVRINSGGGDVFAANAIYTRLKDHKAKITVKIDGWAASAATIIAMAGDVIEIPGNGVFMIHEAKMGLLGYFGKADFAKMTEEITTINQSIVNGYALKTGKPPEEIAALMEATTWFDGKQAVDAGFCDKLMFEEVTATVENVSKIIVNSVALDLSRFPNLPVSLINRYPAPPPDGGFSHTDNTETKNQSKGANEKMEFKTVEELQAAFPDLTRQIAESATAAERKRIQDIDGVALAGFEAMIQAAKYEKPVNAGEVAAQIIAEQKKQGGNYLANRDNDVKNSGVNDAGADDREGAAGGGTSEIDAVIDAVFPVTK